MPGGRLARNTGPVFNQTVDKPALSEHDLFNRSVEEVP